MKDRLFVALQYLLPQHGLSRLVHWATRVRATWFKDAFIRVFLRLFDVDLSDSVGRPPKDFGSFNASSPSPPLSTLTPHPHALP